jgi:hypothetical protein
VRLDISVDDGGNTGSGGPRQASAATTLDVLAVNDAPRLVSPLSGQQLPSGTRAEFQLPQATFVDPDAGDSLQYRATLDSGADLPTWLQFDAANRSFSGTPTVADVGNLTLRVTATDNAGASAQMVFVLSILAPAPTPAPAPPSETIEADEPPAAAVPANTDNSNALSPAQGEPESGAVQATVPEPALDVVSTPAQDAPENTTLEIDTTITVAPQRQFTFDVASTLPVSQADTVLAAALLTQFTDIATSASSDIFTNEDLLRKLEELKRQMLQQDTAHQSVLASSIALTSGLSIGYVVWLIRGGILVSSMLSALPAWQLIDPLPVLATARGNRGRPGNAPAEDPEVEKLFDGKRKSPPKAVKPAPPDSAAQATQDHPSS